jgi:hypothetical protein
MKPPVEADGALLPQEIDEWMVMDGDLGCHMGVYKPRILAARERGLAFIAIPAWSEVYIYIFGFSGTHPFPRLV